METIARSLRLNLLLVGVDVMGWMAFVYIIEQQITYGQLRHHKIVITLLFVCPVYIGHLRIFTCIYIKCTRDYLIALN